MSAHIDIASDPSQPYNTAVILSRFIYASQNSLKATATCQLNARWKRRESHRAHQ